MRKSIIKKMKKRKGFTLIELIIVIAIIAILAALAIPKFGAVKDTANKSADLATGKNIATAVAKLIAEDKIQLPTSTAETAIVSATATGDGATVANSIDGNLTAKLKTNAGKTFIYSLDKDGNITVYVNGVPEDIVYPSGKGSYSSSTTTASTSS